MVVGYPFGCSHTCAATIGEISSFGHVADRCNDGLHAERRSAAALRNTVMFEVWRGYRVEQEGDPVDMRRDLLKRLQPLAGHRWFHVLMEPSTLSAGPGEALHEATADGIV